MFRCVQSRRISAARRALRMDKNLRVLTRMSKCGRGAGLAASRGAPPGERGIVVTIGRTCAIKQRNSNENIGAPGEAVGRVTILRGAARVRVVGERRILHEICAARRRCVRKTNTAGSLPLFPHLPNWTSGAMRYISDTVRAIEDVRAKAPPSLLRSQIAHAAATRSRCARTRGRGSWNEHAIACGASRHRSGRSL